MYNQTPWSPQINPSQNALLQALLSQVRPGGPTSYFLEQGAPPSLVNSMHGRHYYEMGYPEEVARQGIISRYRYETGQHDRIGR